MRNPHGQTVYGASLFRRRNKRIRGNATEAFVVPADQRFQICKLAFAHGKLRLINDLELVFFQRREDVVEHGQFQLRVFGARVFPSHQCPNILSCLVQGKAGILEVCLKAGASRFHIGYAHAHRHIEGLPGNDHRKGPGLFEVLQRGLDLFYRVGADPAGHDRPV